MFEVSSINTFISQSCLREKEMSLFSEKLNHLWRTHRLDDAKGTIARNGEGVKWAKSIRNDTMYLKAVALFHIGEYRQSLRVFKRLLAHWQRGIYSDFTRIQIMSKIKTLESIIAESENKIR